MVIGKDGKAGWDANSIFNKGGGVLHASINYDLTGHVTTTQEGANLIRAPTTAYFGKLRRPSKPQ